MYILFSDSKSRALKLSIVVSFFIFGHHWTTLNLEAVFKLSSSPAGTRLKLVDEKKLTEKKL